MVGPLRQKPAGPRSCVACSNGRRRRRRDAIGGKERRLGDWGSPLCPLVPPSVRPFCCSEKGVFFSVVCVVVCGLFGNEEESRIRGYESALWDGRRECKSGARDRGHKWMQMRVVRNWGGLKRCIKRKRCLLSRCALSLTYRSFDFLYLRRIRLLVFRFVGDVIIVSVEADLF